VTKRSKSAKNFKRWEIGLLAFGALLFASSSVFYVGGISIRKHFLGWPDEQKNERVGKIQHFKGSVRRQGNRAAEFSGVSIASEVYNLDTIVTGSDSSTRLELDDGSVIELQSNTMVKLVFDTRLSFGGISRAANVEVVSGNVTGSSKGKGIVLTSKGKSITIARNSQQSIESKAAPEPVQAKRRAPPVAPSPPLPPPTVVLPPPAVVLAPKPVAAPSPAPVVEAPPEEFPPVMVRISSPKRGERLSVEKGSQVAEREVTLDWTIKPARGEFEVRLNKISNLKGQPEESAEIFKKRVNVSGTTGSVRTMLREPGQYRWEIRRPSRDGRQPVIAQTEFILNRSFEGIETLSPLVGGRTMESKRSTAELPKKFDITLRWKPWKDASAYKVRITRDEDGRVVLLEKEVEGESYPVTKNNVYSGRIFYRVSADLSSGFVVSSESSPFILNFVAPLLVLPPDNNEYSKKRQVMGNDSILMTWQKTNFTDSYELELGADPDFKQSLLRQRVKENFFVFRAPPVGIYWWRVRSFAKETGSPPSEAYKLTMAP